MSRCIYIYICVCVLPSSITHFLKGIQDSSSLFERWRGHHSGWKPWKSSHFLCQERSNHVSLYIYISIYLFFYFFFLGSFSDVICLNRWSDLSERHSRVYSGGVWTRHVRNQWKFTKSCAKFCPCCFQNLLLLHLKPRWEPTLKSREELGEDD